MSDLSFDIDVDPLLRTDLVLDLPGGDWNPTLVVPALTTLSDRLLSQPHLEGVFRLVILRGGKRVFNSSIHPLEIGSGPEAILRGTIPCSGPIGPSDSHTGMTLMVASAGVVEKEWIRRSRWPVLLWLVGPDANDLYIRVHRECKPARTVADPEDASDRLTLVCSRFLDEVATADQPDVTRWIDNRVSPITEGMGYVAG